MASVHTKFQTEADYPPRGNYVKLLTFVELVRLNSIVNNHKSLCTCEKQNI